MAARTSTYPKDRFDDATSSVSRVGAHRRPPHPRARLIAFAWAALATGVIVLLGVVGLLVINDNVEFDDVFTAPTGTAGSSATPTVVPTVDPSLSVAVLNGTPTAGLAAEAGETLTEAGWTVPSVANAEGEDQAATTVYYGDAADEGAALALAQELGSSTIVLTQDFVDTGDLVAVIGADYPAE